MTKREKAKTERRRLIVRAAIRCFIQNGIHQTGIRDIAAKADISLGNVYNHFSGKDDLISEIAASESKSHAKLVTKLEAADDPVLAVDAFLDDYLNHVAQADNAALTIELIAEARRNPAVAAKFEANHQRLAQALAATLKRGMKEGFVRSEIHTAETVALILEAVESLGLRYGLTRQKPSDAARAALREMIIRMLTPIRD